MPYQISVKMKILCFCLFISIFFIRCKSGYKIHKITYEEESRVMNPTPDYLNLYYWAAHPGKKNPSDSIPKALKTEERDTVADVFFIHPTTFTEKSIKGSVWNASLNDAELNLKTDYTSILYQASVFNKDCRVFAPRYRQAHIYSFFCDDKTSAQSALDTAYDDIKKAFESYLLHFNHGRPIIIAAHSQGTVHAARLLKDYFEAKPLFSQLVCAYLVGMPVPENYFSSLKPCTDSSQTGCFTTWRTYRNKYVPDYIQKEMFVSVVVNPLSWSIDQQRIARDYNKGAVLFNFQKILKSTNGAQIHQNVLWIDKPKFPLSFLSQRKNYHPGDYNLFYMNIRENIKCRIDHFLKK